MLTIVMYHYVRDLPRSRFPRIKGLRTDEFDRQLEHIAGRYTVCSLRQVAAAARGDAALPDDACVLTFDDGFIDHWATVFPRLVRRGWAGAFFVPAMALLERRVLDAHKIHFMLAAADDVDALEGDLRAMLRDRRGEHDLPSEDELYDAHAKPGRWDTGQVRFIKALLQHALPEALRTAIVDELFARYVSGDEAAFARELYMGRDHIERMADAGMEFGGHGYSHAALAGLPSGTQRSEIERTVAWLRQSAGVPPTGWTMSYPYGSYDATTLRLLREADCAIGLTTRPEVVGHLERPLELGRLNANDLPPRARSVDHQA